MRAGVLLCVTAGLSACAGPNPATFETTPGLSIVASFTDARALAADGGGRLYVVEAGGVVVIDSLGRAAAATLGAGSERLVDAVDIDPTNGLEWFIADAAGGRVIRVSHDGRLLEDTGVPAEVPPGGIAPAPGGPRGRPMAVAAGAEALYVVEGSRGVVVRWDDASRRRVRVTGGRDAGAGRLVEPVSLAAGPDGSLAVADAGREEVLLFDPHGSLVWMTPVADLRSVSWSRSGGTPALVVAVPGGVQLLGGDGTTLDFHPYATGAGDLVDAVETARGRWLLTRSRLLHAPR